MAAEGPSTIHIVFSMIHGSYCRHRRRFTIFAPEARKFGDDEVERILSCTSNALCYIFVAQSKEHQARNLKVVGSSPTVGNHFSFCILSLSTRSLQVDWFHMNKIKHDIHLR